MAYHDAPIPIKRKGKNQAKNPKSDKDTTVPSEKKSIYRIDRLNLGDPAVDLESDSE